MNTCKLAENQALRRWMGIASLVGILMVAGCRRGEPTTELADEGASGKGAPEVVAEEVAETPDDTPPTATDPVEETVAETAAETAPKEDAEPTTYGPAVASQANDYLPLVGRWIRTDSPYRIEIRAVGRDGRMEAAYFNPQRINVSRAVARNESGELQVFVELRDANYPGATYTLAYHRGKDVLQGVYYQPAMQQSFDVSFARQQAGDLAR